MMIASSLPTTFLTFLTVVVSLPKAKSQAWVRLPDSYTAMKGDFVVFFDLSNSTTSNYVVHVESVETGIRLSELPIPIGLTSGAVIFPCGVVVHGGPHKALLTRGGKVVHLALCFGLHFKKIMSIS